MKGMQTSDLRRHLSTGLAQRLGPGSIHVGFIVGIHRLAIDDPGSGNYRWLLLLDGQVRCQDESGNGYLLTPGDCFVRAPHTPHHVERIDDGRYLEFCLTLPIPYWRFLQEAGLVDADQRFAKLGLGSSLLEQCWSTFAHCRNEADAQERALFLHHVHQLLLRLIQQQHAPDTATRELVARCCLALDRLDQPCSIAGLAYEAGVGEDSLRKAFKQVLGCNPKAYRIRKRIERAITLLRDPQLNLEDIAWRLGYADAFAFSKQFKQQTGISPSRYRIS